MSESTETPMNYPRNHRRGHVNSQPDRPYIGMIIAEKLWPQDEEGNPNPYDKWSLDLLLDPYDGPAGEADVIEIAADNLKIEKQMEGTFDPKTYLGKRVRVVLGDCIPGGAPQRYIKNIEFEGLPINPIAALVAPTKDDVKVLAYTKVLGMAAELRREEAALIKLLEEDCSHGA